MARRIRDKILDSRDARRGLKPRAKPYWRSIGKGLHLGYRKGKRGAVWVLRRYQSGHGYQTKTFAMADDTEDANGTEILDFWQAQEVARNMREFGARGRPYTVAQAVADYLAEHLEGRPSYYEVKTRLAAYVLPIFGDKLVADLTAEELRRWHKDIAKKGARARTKPGAPQNYRKTDNDTDAHRKRQASANRCLSVFKAVLNYVWNEEKVQCERVWLRAKPFKGVDEPRTRYLTIDECKRLINACDAEFRALVRAALESGCRYQELARLSVRDFNPDSGTLHIRKSKTNQGRHVVLTEEGQEFLAGLVAGRPGSSLMLGREWKPGDQQIPMTAACNRAHIEGATFHTLRHTYASHAVMNGAPLMVIARNLGHVDTRMVERHYGHLAPGYVADAIRAAAPRFGNVEHSKVRAM